MKPSPKTIDRIIEERFTVSLMSDSKWDKLVEALCDEFIDGIYINYKLVYDEAIYNRILDMADFKPFFVEPTLYKEVEWIEFPSQYEDYVSKNNLKAGFTTYSQNIDAIKDSINNVGKFELVSEAKKVRLYAYR